MPVLDLTVEQIITLVKQLSPEDQKLVLEAIQPENSQPKEHPWMQFFGKYEDDPQFDEMLAYIEEDRRQLDAEMDEYYRKQDEQEKVQ